MSNLKIIRTRLHLTQEKVAAIIGKTKASVSHYETGRHEIPPDAAKKLIAAATGLGQTVTFDDIYGRRTRPEQRAA
jgi:transcriptional regulator with XRE-family HTH domain